MMIVNKRSFCCCCCSMPQNQSQRREKQIFFRNPSPVTCRHSCPARNEIKYPLLSAELVVILIFFSTAPLLLFSLHSISHQAYTVKITNNNVLFSRSQMHKYIKKSQNTTPCLGLSRCMWIWMCVHNRCFACRFQRGEHWRKSEREMKQKTGFVLQVSVVADEWNSK